jgi:hypothetical protein
MKVPIDLFKKGIAEKKVYYFSSSKLNVQAPHYYICIKRTDDDILIATVCTSQFETVKNMVERQKLPMETLVRIKPEPGVNPFDKDTYIYCNNTFTFTIEEFEGMYEDNRITLSGEISDLHYNDILVGLHASPLIARDIKASIPKPE